MKFGNNIEQMGFEKSGWLAIAISDNVTYMGKPSTPDAMGDEPVWIVKKIAADTGKEGLQYITIKYSKPNVKWSEKENLEYKYFWP